MLKITQKKKSSKITKYCEEKYWILRNIPFVEINIWKLINYSIDMCWNGQGIMIFITKYVNDYNFNMKCKANMI